MNFPTYADAQVYYQWGFDISFCVEGGAITPDQFKEITGKDYGEKANGNGRRCHTLGRVF